MPNGTDHISIPKAFPQPTPAKPAKPAQDSYAEQVAAASDKDLEFWIANSADAGLIAAAKVELAKRQQRGEAKPPVSYVDQGGTRYFLDEDGNVVDQRDLPQWMVDNDGAGGGGGGGGGAVGIGPPSGWQRVTIGTQTYYYDPVSRSVVDQQGTPVRNITSEVLPGTGRLALRDADSGIIIETVQDPNFISDYDKQQLLQQKAQMWWDAARTLIELKGYNYQQAMDWYNTQWDAQERLIDRAVTDHNAKIEAADISTRRAGTMLDILKASIPAGAQLNLPVPGQPGKTFAAPVHQASMKDFFPGPSVEDIAKVAWPDLPPIEMPAKPTPVTQEDIQKELELAMSSIKPGLGF